MQLFRVNSFSSRKSNKFYWIFCLAGALNGVRKLGRLSDFLNGLQMIIFILLAMRSKFLSGKLCIYKNKNEYSIYFIKSYGGGFPLNFT